MDEFEIARLSKSRFKKMERILQGGYTTIASSTVSTYFSAWLWINPERKLGGVRLKDILARTPRFRSSRPFAPETSILSS